MTPVRTRTVKGTPPESKILGTGLPRDVDIYSPVLALTILRGKPESREILCAVRRPEANATHPNVLSVPTMRIGLETARTWPGSADGPDVIGLPSAVEHLFARKLGLADALELGQVTYRLSRFGAWQGMSYIGTGEAGEVVEDLTMYNVEVELDRSEGLFPAETASYAPILWASVPTFLRVLTSRNVSEIDPNLDDIEICVHGLCVETTRLLLDFPK